MDLIFETQRGSAFSIEVGYFDTILEIKGKIEKYRRIPVSRQTIALQGKVLQDDHNIEQCDLYNNSRLQLFISPPGHHSSQVFKPDQPPQPNSTEQRIVNRHQDSSVMMVGSSSNNNNNNNNNKLRVIMVLKSGTLKIPMEVNASDNVRELRKDLAKIQESFELNLYDEGYIFIYKRNVMEDDRSFQWHRVDNGDTIEVFSGTLSRGS